MIIVGRETVSDKLYWLTTDIIRYCFGFRFTSIDASMKGKRSERVEIYDNETKH